MSYASNTVKNAVRAGGRELETGLADRASWHDQYRDSKYIFVGNLDHALTEGDLIAVFSQYGEVVDINLVRSNETGQSRGFAFLGYEKQESTILAVDNFQGIKLAGRVIKVDHVDNYRSKEDIETEKKKSRKEHLNYAEIITKDVLKNKDSTINASSELLNRFNVLKKEKSMIENYRDDSSKRRVIRDIMSGGDDDSMSRRDDRVEKFVDGMDHSRSRKTLGTRQNFKDGNDQSYYFEERPNKRK